MSGTKMIDHSWSKLASESNLEKKYAIACSLDARSAARALVSGSSDVAEDLSNQIVLLAAIMENIHWDGRGSIQDCIGFNEGYGATVRTAVLNYLMSICPSDPLSTTKELTALATKFNPLLAASMLTLRAMASNIPYAQVIAVGDELQSFNSSAQTAECDQLLVEYTFRDIEQLIGDGGDD